MAMAKEEGDYDEMETCDAAADSSRVDADVAQTSLRMFFEQNPNRDAIKMARDAKGGLFKAIDVATFGFILFAPVLPIIPTMSIPAIVIVLWILIGIIMLFKIEYTHRAQVWYTCLNRGIIVDFPKTNTAAGWLCQVPVLVAIMFLFIFGLVTYIGLDPDFAFPDEAYLVTAILAIVGLLFVLMLTKGFVDLEGANHLLTLNLVLHYLKDPELLQARGFKTIHFSQLQKFMKQRQASDKFSWNQLHALSHEMDEKEPIPLFAGTRVFMALHKFKDLDE